MICSMPKYEAQLRFWCHTPRHPDGPGGTSPPGTPAATTSPPVCPRGADAAPRAQSRGRQDSPKILPDPSQCRPGHQHEAKPKAPGTPAPTLGALPSLGVSGDPTGDTEVTATPRLTAVFADGTSPAPRGAGGTWRLCPRCLQVRPRSPRGARRKETVSPGGNPVSASTARGSRPPALPAITPCSGTPR